MGKQEQEHPHEHEECGCGHHHHHEQEECGCGHHHHHEQEECGCGHHHHQEQEECGCGHHHEHKQEECGCHHHEENAPRERQPVPPPPEGDWETRVYLLEGLDCANCAARLEERLGALEGVASCTITFATRQLRLTAQDHNALLPRVRAVVDDMEEGITLRPRDVPPAEKKHAGLDESKKDLLAIALGAALFVIGEGMELLGAPLAARLAALIPAYLILGGQVLLTAGKHLVKGRVLDENFLMSIATLGAFAIGEYPEAVGVMLFYRIGEYFEQRAVERSRSQIMSAVDMRPETVNLVCGEEIRVIPAGEARVGDVLLVRPGDRIPLDGVVVGGESRVDTSPVTGEPVPVRVTPGSQVISGCVNTAGQLTIRAEKPLAESMVTRILNSVENAAASKPAIDKFITRFARVYTPAVVLCAVIVALVLPVLLPDWHFFVDAVRYAGRSSILFGESGTPSVFTALTFLVISCPCALVLSVPLAFFSGIGAASKKGILFKGGSSMEALAQIRAVVMDKTGTLTQGNFRVQQAVCVDSRMSSRELLALAAGCEQFSTHPIAVSIVAAAREQGIQPETPGGLTELAGRGIRAEFPSGVVLCGSRELLEENGVSPGGCSGTQVLLARNGELLGYFVISDTLKPDAAEAVGRMKALGLFTAMLTGDAEENAQQVAEQLGLDQVHARLLPENKLQSLQSIRAAQGGVMFVGDGINDAPVLAGADVGAAMGTGADAAIEAADVVFMNSDVSAIPEAVEIARRTRRVSWQNVYFALAVKLLVMVLGLWGHASLWLAVFADTGVSMLCLLNSIRLLYQKKH